MAYVTDIAVAATDSENWESVRPSGSGWQVVKNKYSEPQDFNQKVGGKYIWMFYQTADSGPGIAAVRFITGEDAVTPPGWTKIDVDFNKGAGGEYIWLCYVKSANTKYIASFWTGYGESEASALGDLGSWAVVLRQDANKGAWGKFIYLGYYYVS
ncbi:MAG: hypothetical protein R3E79_39645 [Caldilineaceae bacterium]